MIEVISLKQHGDLIRFKIALKTAKQGETSNDYNIYNFVVVLFKIESEYNNTKRMAIAIRKHDLSKEWSFKVGLTSKIFNFNQINNCSENWSDWISGKEYTNQWCVDVDITINIIKKYSIIQKKYHEDDTHTDFQLSADDGSVAVHKVYLASHSDVFKAMLDGQWKETAQGQVDLKGVTRQTIQYFKDFMYLHTLPDDNDELCPLLLLATRYIVEDLRTGCMMKIMQTITAENLDSRMEFAVENQVDELKDYILEKIPGKLFASAYYAIKVKELKGTKEPSSPSNE